MRLFAQIASAFVLAAASELFADETLSLLQLRASPKQQVSTNSSVNQPQYSGHAFGCTGRETAVNVISCGLWGDVHQHKQYGGMAGPNSDGTGWFWLAKSLDGEFQAQGFYRQWNGVSTLSHFAFKFGEQTVVLDRDIDGGFWMWKYYWNGVEKSYADTPMEVGGVYWVNRAAGEMVNLGAAAADAVGGVRWFAKQDHKRHSCFEFGKMALWTSAQTWLAVGNGPFGQAASIEVEGSIDYLDKDFGQCANRQQKVEPSEMLVTKEQNDKMCRENGLSAHQCEDPDPPPPPPTKEELCEKNGVDISHAEDLCADQQAHGGDIYESCMYDVCASIDADAQQNAVGGAELEAAMMNPEAACTVNAASCKPCDICSASTSVDLSNVVQNNLGGLGPDNGAEEIRYKNAIDLNGRKVDVVLTAVDAYHTPKVSKNGYSGTGFGRFLMKSKSSTDFKFTFMDAATGELVGVKDLALTFYDLDQAKNSRQQETISACGAEEAFTTSDTELVHTALGACHSFTSTTKGTGKDNPAKPDELTKTQAARSVTYEFHSRASISFSAAVSGSGKNPRPILFSFEPQVACGASDAETQCAQ